tara:strand:- start:1059 stop:2390 length:1332 start_codon:yes stop_codon:yes gene_type:complete
MGKEVTIVGAGLVGSLCSLYMSKRGYQVNVFERRKDLRSEIITAGKSINLALSKRGWTSLQQVGVDDQVRRIAIPVYKRIMHDQKGVLTDQPYGNEGEAIYSVSRSQMNVLMMDLAEKNGANLYFNEKCVDLDFEKSTVTFENSLTRKKQNIKSDFIIGSDGAFSVVRRKMIEKYNHEYNYQEIEHDYKELLIPSGKNNTYLLDKNALHIWPRGNFMLMALANLDGSFTCTLFAPKQGKNSFANLNTKQKVENYFTTTFPSFIELVPDLYNQWKTNPTSALGIVRTYPWHVKDKSLLVGDSAHATVPFYGQGMNCGFEDCRILNDLLNNQEDLNSCFEKFSKIRKPNADGVQELSMHNFIVMRDKTSDPKFLLQKKIEKKFSNLFPEKWTPLYSMVSFTNIPYDKAWDIGMKQEEIMEKIMSIPDIEKIWDDELIMQKINSFI